MEKNLEMTNMYQPDYIQDAKDIASKLALQERLTMQHRKELMDLLQEMKGSIDTWKEEVQNTHQSFHGRLSALEESKSVRNTLLVLAGGAVGTFLTLLGKHFGL